MNTSNKKEREEIDLEELEDAREQDFKAMNELDKVFGTERFKKNQDHDDADVDEEEAAMYNPFAPRKKMTMKHQEYRIIDVGPQNFLKNGQMIQVSVSDPF